MPTIYHAAIEVASKSKPAFELEALGTSPGKAEEALLVAVGDVRGYYIPDHAQTTIKPLLEIECGDCGRRVPAKFAVVWYEDEAGCEVRCRGCQNLADDDLADDDHTPYGVCITSLKV